MRVEKGTVRAPEIGHVWLNSPSLSFHQLRGRVVLVDFWDYTCVNCIRALPYVQAWHERYKDKGLTVIGVHTPEFTFAQYESNVERGVRDFGLTYPIVVDSNREIWKAFANRCWPSKYLLDKEGCLRFVHWGEGAYQECEEVIQELLREIDPAMELPEVLPPMRAEDKPGAACYAATPELYLGHKRGRIGNAGGFKEDQIADYAFSGKLQENKLQENKLQENNLEENCFYASGRWASTVEYLESAEAGEHKITLKYSAAAVNLVMAAPRGVSVDVEVRQDGKPLSPRQATSDTRFRPAANELQSYVTVQQSRMYFLLDNRDFGEHTLELICPPGVALFAFTFTSCVNPDSSQLPSGDSIAS
jgi:thiol-disulfide isomerase/thioredoxin